MRRALASLLAGLTCAGAAVVLSAPSAEAADRVTVRLWAAVKNLPVATETRAGYERSKFRLWIDADGDCQDTRDEVLAAESLVRTYGCDVRVGKWVSYYDNRTVRYSSELDIDHLVPLAEAWDSGARRWNANTRKRFANDLGDPRSLVAVTASTNRSKGDQDPSSWLPQYGRCTYVRQWVAVKIRWSLKVDYTEKHALTRYARNCANLRISVQKASIGTRNTGGGLDPRFGTCTEAKSYGYGPYYRGIDDEYYWYEDRDSDGIVCE